MTEKLKKAAQIQKDNLLKIENNIDELKKRPLFHLASPCGWINDPNGFSFYDGKIHLFFQYHPYSNKWGPMHWGHAVSVNFLDWKFLDPALSPDEDYDRDGCFSGTAIEVDGKHLIVYTSVVDGNTKQNQSIAVGDGINYRKIDGNPVITAKDIPFEFDEAHFRDPKIWKENDRFYLACVIKTKDESGAIVIFDSTDLKKWNYISVADRSNCKLGMMWECPDIFHLDGSDVILISPQGMKNDFNEGWHDGNNSCCMTGKLLKPEFIFERHKARQIDYGIDFYAPQTMKHADGRRILVGWMHNWESNSTPANYLWTGMMTLPRELKVKDEILYQSPVKEIENIIKEKHYGEINFSSEDSVFSLRGRTFILKLNLKSIALKKGFIEIQFAKNNNYHTDIKIDFTSGVISFDRSNSAVNSECENFREFRIEKKHGRQGGIHSDL